MMRNLTKITDEAINQEYQARIGNTRERSEVRGRPGDVSYPVSIEFQEKMQYWVGVALVIGATYYITNKIIKSVMRPWFVDKIKDQSDWD